MEFLKKLSWAGCLISKSIFIEAADGTHHLSHSLALFCRDGNLLFERSDGFVSDCSISFCCRFPTAPSPKWKRKKTGIRCGDNFFQQILRLTEFAREGPALDRRVLNVVVSDDDGKERRIIMSFLESPKNQNDENPCRRSGVELSFEPSDTQHPGVFALCISRERPVGRRSVQVDGLGVRGLADARQQRLPSRL